MENNTLEEYQHAEIPLVRAAREFLLADKILHLAPDNPNVCGLWIARRKALKTAMNAYEAGQAR